MEIQDLIIEIKSLYQQVREERENATPGSLLKELEKVRSAYFKDENLTDDELGDFMIISKAIVDILKNKTS